MPEFQYRARNADGVLVDGAVTAGDRSAAIAMVEQKRLVPIRVQAREHGAALAAPAAPAAPMEPLDQTKTGKPAKETSASGRWR